MGVKLFIDHLQCAYTLPVNKNIFLPSRILHFGGKPRHIYRQLDESVDRIAVMLGMRPYSRFSDHREISESNDAKTKTQ